VQYCHYKGHKFQLIFKYIAFNICFHVSRGIELKILVSKINLLCLLTNKDCISYITYIHVCMYVAMYLCIIICEYMSQYSISNMSRNWERKQIIQYNK
jgi:hypothetical protein